MGRRHVTKPHLALNNVDLSADQTSDWAEVSNYDKVRYLLDYSGSPGSEVFVQVSNDKENIHDLDFGQQILLQAADSPKQHEILINTVAHKYMRIKSVFSSGTGNLTASMTMSSVGA